MTAFGLLADPIQVTGGVNGACSTNCDGSPNLLGNGSDLGFYIPSNTASAAEELLVLLIPNDTTNLFTTDPLGTINVYDPYPGSKTPPAPRNSAPWQMRERPSVSAADL